MDIRAIFINIVFYRFWTLFPNYFINFAVLEQESVDNPRKALIIKIK